MPTYSSRTQLYIKMKSKLYDECCLGSFNRSAPIHFWSPFCGEHTVSYNKDCRLGLLSVISQMECHGVYRKVCFA